MEDGKTSRSVFCAWGLALLLGVGASRPGHAASNGVASVKVAHSLRSMFAALPVSLQPRAYEFLRPNSPISHVGDVVRDFMADDAAIASANEIATKALAQPDHAAQLFSRLGILEEALKRVGNVDLRPLHQTRALVGERMSEEHRAAIEARVAKETRSWAAPVLGSPVPSAQERVLAVRRALIGKDPINIFLRTANDFPHIEAAKIEHMKVIGPKNPGDPLMGKGTLRRIVGVINGKKVFVKLSLRQTLNQTFLIFNEAAWLKSLRDLSVKVPRFYGLTEISGYWGLVSEYVDGIHLFEVRQPGTPEWRRMRKIFERKPDFAFTDGMEQDIRHAYSVIEGELHLAPHDLNFRLGTDGSAYLIDPELLNMPPSHKIPLVPLRLSLADLAGMKDVWREVASSHTPKPPGKP